MKLRENGSSCLCCGKSSSASPRFFSLQLSASRRETELARQQSDIDQELLKDENEALRQQADKLQAALKKSESRAKKATRLLKEKEEKCVCGVTGYF